MNLYEERARERNKLLWNFYYENGEKITTQDCYRLLKTKNLKHSRETFRKWGLEFPPRWGPPQIRIKRLADKLNAYADKLGVSELSAIEMAIALDKPKDRVYYVRQQCDRYKFKIPELKISEEWRRKMSEIKRNQADDDRQIMDESLDMQDEYAQGFLIVDGGVRINPDNFNEKIYMLR